MKNILTIVMGLFTFAAITLCAREPQEKASPAPVPPPRHHHHLSAPHCAGPAAPFCRKGSKMPCGRFAPGHPRPRPFFANGPRKRGCFQKRNCFLMGWKKMMMREDDAAKFGKLSRKIRETRMAYLKTPNGETEKALSEAIRNMVQARQAFEIDRAEKALARAKEAVKEKETIVKKLVEKMKRCPEKRGMGMRRRGGHHARHPEGCPKK